MPFRIVIADPSPSVQKAAQMAFPESDFKLYFFESSTELVNALPQIRPDTILLSLALAGRDAFEVGRYLSGREEFRRVPLFFLKGTFEIFDAEDAVDIVYDGVIQKPFDSEGLTSMVLEAIDRKISPPTLPEEPVLEEVSPEHSAPDGKESRYPVTSGIPDSLRSIVRELVKQEVLEMERELEKRIRARVLSELRERPDADKKESLS